MLKQIMYLTITICLLVVSGTALAVDDQPPILNLNNTSNPTYTENGDGVFLAPNLTIEDADGGTIGAAVVFFEGYSVSTEDRIECQDSLPEGFTESYSQIDNYLTITGVGNASTYENILRNVIFYNVGDDPGSVQRNIYFVLFSASNPRVHTKYFYSEDTGHLYERVRGDTSWTEARTITNTNQLTWNIPSYLANITSQTENDLLSDYLSYYESWIGASDFESEGVWKWMDGPEAGTVFWENGAPVDGQFCNWAPNEPNNALEGTEHYGEMRYSGDWNDFEDSPIRYYFVEHGNDTDAMSQLIDHVTVDVIPVDDELTLITPIKDYTVALYNGTTSLNIGNSFYDPDDFITITVLSNSNPEIDVEAWFSGPYLDLSWTEGGQTTIRVRATSNGKSVEGEFTVTIAPDLSLTNNTVSENLPIGTVVGELSLIPLSGDGPYSYLMTEGEGFALDGDKLITTEVLDYETAASATVTIQVTNGSFWYINSFTESFTINITDANDIPESSDSQVWGTKDEPYIFDASDFPYVLANPTYKVYEKVKITSLPSKGSLTYDGVDVLAEQEILKTDIDSGLLKYIPPAGESGHNFNSFHFMVYDSAYYSSPYVMTVHVNSIPTPLNSSVEGREDIVYTFSLADFNYSDEDGGALEEIQLVSLPTNGEIRLDNQAVIMDQKITQADLVADLLTYHPDLNTNGIDSFGFKVYDGLAWSNLTALMEVDVVAENDAPTQITLSNNIIAENLATDSVIGQLTTSDIDSNSFTYTLVAGAGADNNELFDIVGTELRTADIFDFEMKNTYTVRIQTDDGLGGTYVKVFSIQIVDVNDAPSINNQTFTINENSPVATLVGRVTASDEDPGQILTYSIISGNESNLFEIDSGTGDIRVANDALDFEVQEQYQLTIQVSDDDFNPLSSTGVVTINLLDQNDTPSIVNQEFEIAENSTPNTVIGTVIANDVDSGDSLNYTIVGGNESGFFDLDATTGQLIVSETGELNYEQQSAYSLMIEVSDQQMAKATGTITIRVLNQNDPVTDINLDNLGLPENQGIQTTVGNFSSSDEDLTDVHTYTLVAGAGDEDNGKFIISGAVLQTSEVLNYEVQNNYTIRVRCEDQSGDSYEKTFTITVSDQNDPVTDVSLDSMSLSENQAIGTVVGYFSSVDEDPTDTHTYSFVMGVGDVDNTKFNIVGNALKTAEVFNYEAQSSFAIRVRSEDQAGTSIEKSLIITVRDENDPIVDINLVNTTIAENQPVGSLVGVLETVDQDINDTFTYSLVAGEEDNHLFTVDGALLKTAQAFNYESQSSYSIRVRSTDQTGNWREEVLVVSVMDENDPPEASGQEFAVAENSTGGTVIGQIIASDEDAGQVLSYTIVAGNSSGIFGLDPTTGELSVSDSGGLDFESSATHSLNVRIADNGEGNLSLTIPVTITVTDQNDRQKDILLDQTEIAENQPVGSIVGTLATVDEDVSDTFTYTPVSGAGDVDNHSFTIEGDLLKTAEIFNYETKSSYSIRVRTTDQAGNWLEDVLTVSVVDENDPPQALTQEFSVAENSPSGTVVGQIIATDEDAGQALNYTIVAGNSLGSFELDSATGELSISDQGELDFENLATYQLNVQITDDGEGSLKVIIPVTITVTDQNEKPDDILMNQMTIEENQPVGSIIGAFTTVDQDVDDTFTYTLVPGDGDVDNHSFTIENAILKTTEVFNYENKNNYSIRVRSTDQSGKWLEKVLTLTVTDVNDFPTTSDQEFSIVENSLAGTLIGQIVATDEDVDQSISYAIVEGNSLGTFELSSTTGELFVAESANLDYETQATYDLTVKVTDSGGLTVTISITIMVTNQNEAPQDILLDQNQIAENLSIGSTVGLFATVDEDVNDTFSYSLVAGEGDIDNPAFTIEGASLKTTETFNYEEKQAYSIRVNSSDSGDVEIEKIFLIQVLDANDLPEGEDVTIQVVEDETYTFQVDDFGVFSDEDEGDILSEIIITSITGSGQLNWQGQSVVVDDILSRAGLDNGELGFIPGLNEFGSNYATITYRLSDGEAYSEAEYTMTINIESVNDAPVITEIPDQLIKEGEELTFQVQGSDPDGDPLTYKLENGPIKATFDEQTGLFSWKTSYQDGGVYEFTFTVSDGVMTSSTDVQVTVEEVARPDMTFELEAEYESGQILDSNEIITYSMTLTNNGTADLVDASIQATIPSSTEYVNGSTRLNGEVVEDVQGQFPLISGLKVNSPGESAGRISITSESSVSLEFKVRTLQDLYPGTQIAAQATLYGTGEGSSSLTPLLSDNPATSAQGDPTESVIGNPVVLEAWEMVQDDNGGIVENGDILTIQSIIRNPGLREATQVQFRHEIPENTTYMSGTVQTSLRRMTTSSYSSWQTRANPLSEDGDIQVELQQINAGEEKVVRFQVQYTGGESITTISSQGKVVSDEIPEILTDEDGDLSNGVQPTVLPVGTMPILEITQTVRDINGGEVLKGEELVYQIQLQNKGNGPANAATIYVTMDEGLEYLDDSTILDGSRVEDQLGMSQLTTDAGLDSGIILPGEKRTITYMARADESLEIGTTIENTARYTAVARAAETGKPEDIPLSGTSQSDLTRIQIGGTPGLANLTGQLMVQETLAEINWIIELWQNQDKLEERTLDDTGVFRFNGLTSRAVYQIHFKHPDTGVTYAGVKITDLEVSQERILAEIPIFTTGIVYDAMTRMPVEGARIEILGPTGEVIDPAYLMPGQQGQVTGADGMYKFSLRTGGDFAAGEYEIKIIPPGGYSPQFPSRMIPPINSEEGYTLPDTGVVEKIVDSPVIPELGAETTYYITFVAGNHVGEVMNNHIPLDPLMDNVLLLTKKVEKEIAVVGDLITYTIEVKNLLDAQVGSFIIYDEMPVEFKFALNGANNLGTFVEEGQHKISWQGLTLGGGESLTLKYTMVVGTGVQVGETYTNRAYARYEGVNANISNTGQAVVKITFDPLLDQTVILGKVFYDLNLNGIPDEDESGIPGVKILTVSGQRIITDEYGRFHLVQSEIKSMGTNLILKVDANTVPLNLYFTTENPRVIRMTPGILQKVYFGLVEEESKSK